MKRMILRLGIVAVVALGVLAAEASYFLNEKVFPCNPTAADGDSGACQKFAEACSNALEAAKADGCYNASLAVRTIDKAYVILVESEIDFELRRGTVPGKAALKALENLLNFGVNVAILCHCPDFENDPELKEKKFWELSENETQVDHLAHKVVIYGESSQCLNVDPWDDRYWCGTALIYGMTFVGGHAEDGGGANANNRVRFVRCKFDQCNSTGKYKSGGGGLANLPSASRASGAFTPRRFGDKLDEMTQKSCSFCTFTGCWAKDYGGAIYGGGSIADCTFNDCSSAYYGGAVSDVETVERSMFLKCEAKDGPAGAVFHAKEISSSLFVGINSTKEASALRTRKGVAWHATVKSCTFVNCNGGDNRVLEKETKVYNSLFVGSADEASSTYEGKEGCYWFKFDEGKELFVNCGETSGDFHVKPDQAERCKGYSSFGLKYDLDRLQYDAALDKTNSRPYLSGCYRYNSQKETEDLKKNLDVAIMNPLIVTTPEDVVDPYDGRISFREACSNLMVHVAPPRGIDDQWPRITFDLPSGSRYIVIADEPIVIDDAMRKNSKKEENTKKLYTPIVIDGGIQGLSVRQNGRIDGPAFRLSSAGRLINLTFDETPLEIGANSAKELGADTTVYATNCLFKGGADNLPLVKAVKCKDAKKCPSLDFTRCSFVNPSNATSAVTFDQAVAFKADFTCCTLAGFDKGVGTVVMTNALGNLTFLSCTFALNGPSSAEEAFADIWIGDGVKGGSVHLADCLFADGPDRALHCPASFAAYGEIRTDRDVIHSTETVDNFAGKAANAIDTVTPERLVVAGVSQLAFRPKHTGSARQGKAVVDFADKSRLVQPATDIFGAPQEGARVSLGSRFVDDIETKSVTVNIKDDINDPYDDLISFREAIAYGLSDYKTLGNGRYVTPLFPTNVFPVGQMVRLTLDSAIDIRPCKAFELGYAVWIKPREGEQLELGTSLSGGGLFRQAAGTRLKFDDVVFEKCYNFNGPGGVLDSEGQTRFNRCRFKDCFACELGMTPALRALENAYAPINGLLGLSTNAYGIICRVIPEGFRERFQPAPSILSNAQACCSLAISEMMDSSKTFVERLAFATAQTSNFVERTEGAAEAFNAFNLYAPTIAMRLNEEGFYVNTDLFDASLAPARAAIEEFEALREGLLTNEVAVSSSGGALRVGDSGKCIVYDATAQACTVLGGGGFLDNAGDFKGVNLTLTGNNAIEGACILNRGGTNQLASVAIVNNRSEANPAVCVYDGQLVFLNSIVVANEGGGVAAVDSNAVRSVASLVDAGETVKLSDVFASTQPVMGGDTNHVRQFYYPLRPDGPATHKGTFVFFNSDTGKPQADGLDSEWIDSILYSPDADGFTPKPQPLFGTKAYWNTYLLYDLLGDVIRIWENPKTFSGPIPASMGPVPNAPPEHEGLVVTITDDIVSTIDNETSLREAAAYAMASNGVVVFDSELVHGKKKVFPLKNQIVVPSGKTLRISATLGEVTLKPDEGCSTRFFRVERGGRLELEGIIMDGGYAKGDYEVGKRPADDDDGGAICSEGELVLTGCTVMNCSANGYGGAVWSSGGMTATGCTFADNFAQRGGGVCSSDEKLRLSGVSITGNTAQDYGGGLYIETGSNDVLATGMTITGNNAKGETVTAGPNRGGGVYLTANMAAKPGTVTISGTVANNTGGNDSRDGGTEPVSPVQTSETPDKEGVPFTPPQRHMSAAPRLASAANALGAAPTAPQRVISATTTQDRLTLLGDFDASEQVCITDGACLTLTGKVTSAGTVDVSNRAYPEGCHPRITVDGGATLKALSGFYRSTPYNSPYAELVIDGGTVEISGGPFTGTGATDSSGTIALRNGATLDADIDISLNSAVRTNTVSDSTVNLHNSTFGVENGARIEMSGSTLQARSFKIGNGSSALIADCTNKLTSAVVQTAGGADRLVVCGGLFQADALTTSGASQGILFDEVACDIGALALGATEITFSDCGTATFGSIRLNNEIAETDVLSLTFDYTAAECTGNVALQGNAQSVVMTLQGTNAELRVSGDFSFGGKGGGVLVFDIPETGWTNAPLRIDGTCTLSQNAAIRITNTDWMRSGEILKVPLIAFKTRPDFISDAWLENASLALGVKQCALAYDEARNALVVEYDINQSSPVCKIGDREFYRVSDALECARPHETVELIASAVSAPLTIPRYVTLDLCGFFLQEPGDGPLPMVVRSEGVLVVYHATEADALFNDRFTGTMRFGDDVVWESRDGGTITFVKGTDVTIGDGTTPLSANPSSVHVVTRSLADTYGLKEGWTVDVFGPAELGGAGYEGCSIAVDKDVRIVTPMKLTDAKLEVGGALTFDEGTYIEFGSLSNCSVYARSRIDFRKFRVTDNSKVDVLCTELADGTFWYHPDASAVPLVAEVDCQRYTLAEAFRVANGNGHDVTLLRDDDDEATTLIPVSRDIAFDVNGHWIRGANGRTVTFSVTNGRLDVFGGGRLVADSDGGQEPGLENVNVAFNLAHGASGDGQLALSGGTYATTNGAPIVTVDAACTAAVLALTNGTSLLAPHACAVETLVRLDGFVDCLFDDATVKGLAAKSAIVHHAARIVVTNGASLVSKDVTIRQTALGACPAYDFTLEVAGEGSQIRSYEAPHCVASDLTAASVGAKSVMNRFICSSGCLQCPTGELNTAVSFFGKLEYDVTGGFFGGLVAPFVSPNYVAVELRPHGEDLYWQVVRPGQPGVYVVKIGDTRYESLEEAFSFVHSNDLVTMLADYSPSYNLRLDVPIVLDLVGCAIRGPQMRTLAVGPSVTLTIGDGIGSGRIVGMTVGVDGTLKVLGGTFVNCILTGDGTFEFDGGTLDKDSSIVGTGLTTLIIRNGTFNRPICLTNTGMALFKNIDVSGGEYYDEHSNQPFFAENKDLAPTNFLSGGVMKNASYYPMPPMPKKYLVDGYEYKRLSDRGYSVVKDEVEVALVDETTYTDLKEAFEAAAKAPRKQVTLLADYTKSGTTIDITESVMLSLNDFNLAPKTELEFNIKSNATLVVDSLYSRSACTNVCFFLGENSSRRNSTGNLHLAGGSYYNDSSSSSIRMIQLNQETCLIDREARLETVSYPVIQFLGGTLAVTNAELVASGSYCVKDGFVNDSGTTCSLRIGDGAKLTARDEVFEVYWNKLDLDISGTNCEFRSMREYKVFSYHKGLSVNQVGISGGRYYGYRDLSHPAPPPDELLAKDYDWKNEGTEEHPCWTPVERLDIAEVDGQKFKSLAEAFAAANASGKSVKLLVDYSGAGGQLSVTKSYELELGKHDLRPSSLLRISISDGASFKLAGDSIDCQNVYFVVGGADGSAGALHLSGGDYGNVEIDTEQAGTCLIDGGARLEGDCPVWMLGGTLAVTNATISGLTYGICADVLSSVTNVLRIGNSVEVSSRQGSALNIRSPSKEGVVDLDISGTCIFRAPKDIKVITSEVEVLSGQAGITGGRFFGARPDDTCLNKDYGWKRVNTESAPCWTPYLMPDVAEVNGRRYKSLDEALAAANASGKPVNLVANYTYRGGSLSVAKSCELNLNGYVLAPSEMLDMTISGGASFKLNGTGVNSTCSNVHFVVQGESDSKTVALHLAGGRYEYDAGGNYDSVVTIMRGTCLIDGGAVLKGKFPVEVCGGTLAMTNATIHAEKNGIWAWDQSGAASDHTNVLRIGEGVKVYTAATSGFAPIFARYAWIDLDISGNCEFHAQNGNGSAIVCDADAVPGQAGISGGFFYGKKPVDKYLATGYVWENVGSESAPCWTPVKVDAPQPTVNEGIRIEDGKVFSGDFEITDAVTIRGDGSVELNPGGSVGGVRVTPVIGDLPPGEGDETEPFAVGEGSVSLTVQTIPGLTYVLLRGETPDKVDEAVASGMATKNVMTLEDFDKPKDGAFYLIKVMIK